MVKAFHTDCRSCPPFCPRVCDSKSVSLRVSLRSTARHACHHRDRTTSPGSITQTSSSSAICAPCRRALGTRTRARRSATSPAIVNAPVAIGCPLSSPRNETISTAPPPDPTLKKSATSESRSSPRKQSAPTDQLHPSQSTLTSIFSFRTACKRRSGAIGRYSTFENSTGW